jgi:flagellar basal body-associated protein FliL
MSENDKDKKSAPTKFPTAVAITIVICTTVVILTVAGMIYGWAMIDKISDKRPDGLPDNITINNR